MAEANSNNLEKLQKAVNDLNKFGISNEEFLKRLKEGSPFIYECIMSIGQGSTKVHIINDEEAEDSDEEGQ